jgi:putative hydrolase of the HAD superfamily
MKAIVFDLDDTLYKEADFVYGAFMEVAHYLSEKYRIDKDELYQSMIKLLSEKGRGSIFNDICDMYNLDEDIDSLVEIYRNSAPDISLYPDAELFLKHARGKYKLGLLTDGLYYVQRNKIRLLGIEEYFDSIVVTDELGKDFWKPNTAPYIRIANELSVPLESMMYVGDNPKKDFYGAKKLGISTVRVIRTSGDYMNLKLDRAYEADIVIQNMNELIGILGIS